METNNPFADEPLPAHVSRLESIASETNPYAAPAGAKLSGKISPLPIGIWRHGDLVLIHQSLDLPDRCVWTNEPAAHRFRVTLSGYQYFGATRWTIQFRYGVNPATRRKMRQDWLWGVGTAGIGAAIMFSCFIGADWLAKNPLIVSVARWLVPVLPLVVLLGLYWIFRYHHVLRLAYRDGEYFALSGAREPFLKSLPVWRG